MTFRDTAVGCARTLHELKQLRTDERVVSNIDGPDGLKFDNFRFKRLGKAILAAPHQIGFSGKDTKTEFSWGEEDIAMGLVLHLGFKSRYAPEKIRAALNNLARYITYNGLNNDESVRVIGGITHRPLAIAATRYGFRTVSVPINQSIEPSKIMSEEYVNATDYPPFELAVAYRAYTVLDTYDKLGLGKGRRPEARQALFAYMPTNEFLDRYGDQEVETWRLEPPEPHTLGPFNEYGYPIPLAPETNT